MEENDNVAPPVWIKWEKSFETGIPDIDKQHKYLTTLCNNLRAEIMRFRAENLGETSLKEILSSTLRETVSYALMHFQDEERLMELADYEKFEEHKKSHHAFVLQVKKMLVNFNDATFQDALDFCNFLHEWVLKHIGHEDRLYVASVHEYMNKISSSE